MARFFNPYHFVPITTRTEGQRCHDVKKESFATGASKRNLTHDRYVEGFYSGRLVARLTTVTPTAVGNEQARPQENQCANVEPYRPGGHPAIAASSLRGLIGSVIEAASNGPMRVLTDRIFSYRKGMQDSLSAIGLVTRDAAGGWELHPMCLPTLESRDGGRTFEVPSRFYSIFKNAGPRFKVYFGDRAMISNPKFRHRTATSNKDAVAMQIKRLAWAAGSKVAADRSLHVKNGRYALSQIVERAASPQPGYVRVLGCFTDERREHIPKEKKHELWLPLPDPRVPTLPIPDDVLERFHGLAKERTEADSMLPYEPLNTRPTRRTDEDTALELQDHDMVYFDLADSGAVKEISFSAIWRARVDDDRGVAATAHMFVQQIDPELRPLGRDRKEISLSEQLLGFVEERPKIDGATPERLGPPAVAFASRLRFADAQARPLDQNDLLESPVTLKILATPKTPCPALYFKSKDGSGMFIEKRGLRPNRHWPQGRKWYLHARSEKGEHPWKTGDEQEQKKQKNIVQPIKRDKELFFHVDFDNLSVHELGLLHYALSPSEGYHHKIGMGKPLGLGSVKIEILGMFFIDRRLRYSLQGLREARYSLAEWTSAGKELRDGGSWPDRYKRESSCENVVEEPVARIAPRLISDEVRAALGLLGDYRNAPPASEVHYPTMAAQRNKEKEHYKWFVFNDGQRQQGRAMLGNGQFLPPLRRSKKLPPLAELDWV